MVSGTRGLQSGSHPGLQERGGQEVGAAGGELPPQVPPRHAAAADVAGAAHYVRPGLPLLPAIPRAPADPVKAHFPQPSVSAELHGASPRMPVSRLITLKTDKKFTVRTCT